jgi:hypothetical protein
MALRMNPDPPEEEEEEEEDSHSLGHSSECESHSLSLGHEGVEDGETVGTVETDKEIETQSDSLTETLMETRILIESVSEKYKKGKEQGEVAVVASSSSLSRKRTQKCDIFSSGISLTVSYLYSLYFPLYLLTMLCSLSVYIALLYYVSV